MGAATSNMPDSVEHEVLTRQKPTLSLTSKTPFPLTLQSGQSGLPNDWLPPPLRIPLVEPEREDLLTLYDGFDLDGIDIEDLIHWSQAAPQGQKLEDAKSHENRASPKSSSSMSNLPEPEAAQL